MMNLNIKRVLVGRLREGDDLLRSLIDIVKKEDVGSGAIQLIGSLKRVNLGYYSRDQRKYFNKMLKGVFELVSCMGNVSWKDDEPVIHIHMAVSSYNGETLLGHVLEGNIVDATVEYIIIEFDKRVERAYDEYTGLNLLEV